MKKPPEVGFGKKSGNYGKETMKLIIFDYDGVIVDSLPFLKKILHGAQKHSLLSGNSSVVILANFHTYQCSKIPKNSKSALNLKALIFSKKS